MQKQYSPKMVLLLIVSNSFDVSPIRKQTRISARLTESPYSKERRTPYRQ